ncbi:exopolysaccharide biosynthesis protein [Legionella resiliens]|uniref:Exopolysaccharide biosynthesis protein n=1 Tax=Legionella resiliens TaxID=2905958 RepID=A0ABS8X4F7_9GAMM|nr:MULTISPECIES: exopolysaccharide biosynthesis protein [unclassified Legionella]MCE0723242.1 exopolysaccharide biosynthesis protein [Legionella sp. 9fVS26]MCE3532395.1 exopolysaccharide biosynthesis protein [Legionella sp. 8cVS16]
MKKLTKEEKEKDHTLGKTLNKFQEKDHFFLIILLAIPPATPLAFIPGFSLIFGISIALITLQLLVRHNKLWLPQKLKNKKIPDDINEGIIKVIPYVQFLEKYIKRRWIFLSSNPIKYFFIAFLFLLSIFLILPIPYVHLVFSFAIIAIATGLIERDGFLLISALFFIIIYTLILFFILNSAILLGYKLYKFLI